MDGIKQILDSQHGIMGIGLITAATVLTAIGVLSIDDWKSYTQLIFGITAGTHAIVSTGNAIANRGGGSNIVQDMIKRVADSSSPAAQGSVTATVTKESGNA